MYLSRFTTMTDRAAVEDLVRRVGVAQLVTVDDDGLPQATLLPILWRGDRVIAHASAANPQFAGLGGSDGSSARAALAVVTGSSGYVSPNWLPTKARHGFAVPTWNYQVVHLRGMLEVYADRNRLLGAVMELAAAHEGERNMPWTLDEAPKRYIDGLLLGIVGLELTVTGVEAKAKLSRNRVPADRQGVIDGLRREPGPGSHALADAMEATLTEPTPR